MDIIGLSARYTIVFMGNRITHIGPVNDGLEPHTLEEIIIDMQQSFSKYGRYFVSLQCRYNKEYTL